MSPRLPRAPLAAVAGLCALFCAAPAFALLKPGTPAPPFVTQAALGGAVSPFTLATALAKGPVVVYFYPKSFTSVCTAEAHAFSERIGEYAKLHATVIGISGDDIATQRQFSAKECRSKFRVGADQGLAIAGRYDARLGVGPLQFADRVSYVIAPNGTIVYALSSGDPDAHVAGTLAALRTLAH